MNKLNPTTLFPTEDRIWMAILLLNYKDKVFTIREFSKLSGLSLGFISQFSNLLKDTGYMADVRQMKLKLPGALLDILRDIYFFEKHDRQSYYIHSKPEETIKKIRDIGKDRSYALTRMAGASKIAPFVRFELVDFYVSSKEEIAFWKEKLELVDVELSGNINLIIPSDKRILNDLQTVDGIKIVNNIQLYLDLYKYPARGREQAEHLREQKIKLW